MPHRFPTDHDVPAGPQPARQPEAGPLRRWRAALVAAALLLAGPGLISVATAGSRPKTASTPSAAATSNPLAGATFWRDPNSNAAKAAAASRSSDPQTAARYDRLAAPRADWFGDWIPSSQVQWQVAARVSQAQAAGAVPVLVAYAIPQRDCGGYSAGGSDGPAAYRSWITSFAQGIGSARTVVILEPDALAGISCLSSTDQATRLDLLRYAVVTLAAQRGPLVYLDAGHASWVPVEVMADRLRQAGVAAARGFALNVSNFDATVNELRYGDDLAARTGGHFVVDTSRNGNGASADGAWCNPPGRAVGAAATTVTGDPWADALLWVKTPGESDGDCGRGEPGAGTWWPDYALGLVPGTGRGFGFDGGAAQGWGVEWGSTVQVVSPGGAAGTLGLRLTGGGWPAVGVRSDLTGLEPGGTVQFTVRAPEGVGAAVSPVFLDGSWGAHVLPARQLVPGANVVTVTVPDQPGPVRMLGLQVDGQGWTGQLDLDAVRW